MTLCKWVAEINGLREHKSQLIKSLEHCTRANF